MTIVKKVKKAQNGVKKKSLTENRIRWEKNISTDSAFDTMRKFAGLDRSDSISSSARAKAIKSGEYREDKKTGDLFRVKKASMKKGGKITKKPNMKTKLKKYK